MIGTPHWSDRLSNTRVKERLIRLGYAPEFAAQAARLRKTRDYFRILVMDALGDDKK